MHHSSNQDSLPQIDMPAFISRVTRLLKEQKKTPARMARDLGFSSGLFSQWKQSAQLPSGDKLYKIAVYLGVSIDYLLGLDPHAATADIRREIALELEPLNEEALERILDYVRFTVAQQSHRRPSPPPLPPEVD